MPSARKRIQINNLARACKKAFMENPEKWVDEEGFLGKPRSIFDFPDYGGLPKRISNRLSPDCVDVIQEYAGNLIEIQNSRSFSKVKLEKLLLYYSRRGYAIP